jgi:hypothetical protein
VRPAMAVTETSPRLTKRYSALMVHRGATRHSPPPPTVQPVFTIADEPELR